jgi:hypothetical protein
LQTIESTVQNINIDQNFTSNGTGFTLLGLKATRGTNTAVLIGNLKM